MFIISAFSVRLPCTGNLTGIAAFSIGLEILSRRRKLAGTPLKLRLRWRVTAFVIYLTDVILVQEGMCQGFFSLADVPGTLEAFLSNHFVQKFEKPCHKLG